MVFKCKMCGGDIEPIDEHIGKCLYCNSMMTLPNLNDERIVNLYNRANDLRLKSEFDKAQKIYESILEIDNNQIEAHFGIILCKYGVEYVDDPRTKLKIPTCHRTRVESIYSDLDYEFIKKNAKGEALELYEKEAKQINSIQKRILEIANKEEPYDIFICYKETDEKGERTKDSVIAEDIYEQLTNQNYRVFFSRITLEDKIGEEYEPYIFNALNSAKVMVVVGTSSENLESAWVKNEWSRYLKIIQNDKTKTLIPVYSNIDAYKLPEDFSMLQAQNMDKIGAMQDLIRGIKKLITNSKNGNIIDTDVEKFKKIMDEASNIGNGKYEVTKIKDKLPSWYYTFLVISIVLILGANLFNTMSARAWGIGKTIIIQVILSSVSCFFTIIGCILCFSDRKSYRIGKCLFLLGTIAKIFACCDIYRYLDQWLKWGFGYFIPLTLLIDISLLLINPKWHIDSSSKLILNEKEKEKQEASNNKIIQNFREKEKIRRK